MSVETSDTGDAAASKKQIWANLGKIWINFDNNW